MIPSEILNDPLTRSLMDSSAAQRARYGSGPTILIPWGSPRHDQVMDDARWIDAYATAHHGQRDRCHHFCAAQLQLAREGYMMIEVGTWIRGYAVRDTMNDGRGTLAGGRIKPGMTKTEALEWARAWHAEDPEKRCVIAGYGFGPETVQS
jgi:hypothetical protein